MLRSGFRKIARLSRRIAGIDEHARAFNKIYSTDAWIGGGSGSGSTPAVTESYREFLTTFIKQHDIKSVVDLGCGDWQFSKLIDWSGVDYTGIDVSSVVLRNTGKHSRPGVRFAEMNGVTGDLPVADLLIMKDVIQHWTNADVTRFLPQLKKFKYALITNGSHKGSKLTNLESSIAGYRPVDLTAAPFDVPGKFVFEFQADEPKITFLWTRRAAS